jgi:hypothetical protein
MTKIEGRKSLATVPLTFNYFNSKGFLNKLDYYEVIKILMKFLMLIKCYKTLLTLNIFGKMLNFIICMMWPWRRKVESGF